ncbi:MAG: succinate dehydrogenase assembly factor 2 [Magnetovibrio sp.]|nr:succinate dehydrogenase assembly factor 2 [Magnetovibrio sp.]
MTMDAKRKKILFQSQHCGMKENDFMLGGFAAARIADLPDAQLADFERLLAESDNDIYDWLTGRVQLPARHDNALVRALIAYNNARPDGTP